MTALLRGRANPLTGWLAVVLGLCLMLGVLCGASPKYGLFATMGLGFIAVVFMDLVLGIAIFAVLSFLDVLTIGGAAVSFDKVAGLLLFSSWAARQMTMRRQATRDILSRHAVLFVSMFAFVAWSLISTLWATKKGVAFEEGYRDALDMLLIPITYAAVRTRRDLYTIVIGYLIGAGISAIYGIFTPPSATSKAAGRLVGSLGEANQQATVLVAALALAIGLVYLARRSPRVTAVIVVVSGLSIIGLVTTLSRAGLIAFGVVLVSGVFFGGRWRRHATVLMAIGLVGIPLYFLEFAPPHALERVSNGQTSGRNDIWKVGWRMFLAQPLTGVGAGNFQYVSANYLQHPGLITRGDYFLVTPIVAQNIYLEQLSALGVPGLIFLMGILIAAVAIPLKAAHIFERIGDPELELLSRCVVLALFAFLAADFFASELTSKQLWTILALGPALLKLADGERRGVASAAAAHP